MTRLYFSGRESTTEIELWEIEPLGDLNADGTIDASDAGLLFANWSGAGVGDLTGDGIIDAANAGLLFANWTGDGVPTRPSVWSHPVPFAVRADVVRFRRRDVDRAITNWSADHPLPFQ